MRFVSRLNSIISLLIIISIYNGYAQHSMRHYNNKNFDASLSNFAITQDSCGYIYSANLTGLLRFDGQKWTTITNSQMLVTDIFHSDIYGSLFFGSKNDYGTFSINERGQPIKTSLHTGQSKNNIEFLIWDILEDGKQLIFSGIEDFILLDDTIYNKSGNTYFELRDCIAYYDSSQLLTIQKDGTIINRIPFNGKITSVTGSSDNLWILSNNKIYYKGKETDLSPSQSGLKISKIFATDNYLIIIYVNKGIDIIQLDDKISKRLFENTTVKNAYVDNSEVIWLALQNGIGYFFPNNPISQIAKPDDVGSIFTMTQVAEGIAVGGNKGLKLIDSKTSSITDKTSEFIRSLNYSANSLKIGTSNSFINKDISLPMNNVSLLHSVNDSVQLIGNAAGFIIYDLKRRKIVSEVKLTANMFYNNATYFDGRYWIGSKFNGLLSWDLKSNLNHYAESEGIPILSYNIPYVLHDQLICFSTDGVYHYDINTNLFTKKHSIEGKLEYVYRIDSTEFITSVKNKFGDRQLNIVSLKNDRYETISTKLNAFDYSYISEIVMDGEGNYWFASPEGLFKYDNDKGSKFDHEAPFNTLISQVTTSDSLIFGGYYATHDGRFSRMVLDQPASYIPHLDFDRNALKFEFTAPYFIQSDKIKFKYYLEGNETNWSGWTKERSKEYTNLSPGKYTFHVTSENVFGIQGRTASYTFHITPPWYMTGYAYSAFVLLAALGIWLVALGYTYRVRQHRKKLKLLVADRTFEVLTQKKEIETQNEQLKEQNEEIRQQRDAIDEKNQELEMSQEEVNSINDRLQELNTQLEKKVEDRTTEIRSTVQKLKSTIMELDTFVYRASHDLKGPISRIHGLTSLAKLESENPNDQKYYELIDVVARNMSKMLAKLTQVHEVININVTPELVDLPVVITKAREANLFLDQDNSTKYIFDLKNLLEIKTDMYLIEVILINLIENALIFKKPNQTDHYIKITSKNLSDRNEIIIEDNGTGIPAEHIDRIFDMFYRGSDQSKGNGLGLYLCKMALEKLDGQIDVVSEFEEYTKFIIRLKK